MRIVDGWTNVPDEVRGAAIAIGNFDGVHRGHQAVIGAAISAARQHGWPAGVMVFEPHPREFFQPSAPHFRLTPRNEKLRVFESLSLDFTAVIPFESELAKLDHHDFIERVLVLGFRVRQVVVGYDFFFGRNRSGSPESMILGGIEHDFEVSVVQPVAEKGEVFSSSAIRLKLAQGDVAGAAHDLGRHWRVTGTVVGGAKRGTGMGYPTANVPMPKGTALGHGIYAVRATVDDRTHNAAAYLGTRPTFDDGMPVLEVFLLDFDGDLYGRGMAVEFIGFVRDDRKFDGADALVRQMDEDVGKVREILARASGRQSG